MKATACRGCGTPTVVNPDRFCTQCRLANDAVLRESSERARQREDAFHDRESRLPTWEANP